MKMFLGKVYNFMLEDVRNIMNNFKTNGEFSYHIFPSLSVGGRLSCRQCKELEQLPIILVRISRN